MELPKPTPNHDRLRTLIGRFSGPETVYHSPWTNEGTAVGQWTIRGGLDGFFVIVDYMQQVGTKMTMSGHGVIGYDVKRNVYTLHWFDTFGKPPHAALVGQWDGTSLVFETDQAEAKAESDGGHRARTIFGIESGALVFRAESDGHGSWEPLLEGSYRRIRDNTVEEEAAPVQ